MPKMSDDNIVVDFRSQIPEQAEEGEESTENQEPAEEDTNEQVVDKKALIASAKLNGLMEINKFKEYINEFTEKVNSLVLFNGYGDSIHDAAMAMIDNAVEPLLKGRVPLGMPEEMYREVRLKIFNDLIKRYNKPARKNDDNDNEEE
jgi:hypothetical protein